MKRALAPFVIAVEAWDPTREAWLFVESRTLPRDDDLAYVLGVESVWLASGVVSEHIDKRIRKKRGAPHDLTPDSERLLAESEQQTWLTVTELRRYGWNRQVQLCGYVGPTGYGRFKGSGRLKGSPFNERRGHSLGAKYLDSIGATRLSNDAMDDLLAAQPELAERQNDPSDERRYTVVEVTQTLAEALGFGETLEWLMALSASREARVIVGL